MAPVWSHWWISDKNLQKIYLCLSVALHVKWKGMPIYSAKRRLKFTFNLRYISLYCLLLLIVAPTLPIEVFFLFSYCSRVNLPARKKKSWSEVGCVAVQCSQRFDSLNFDITGLFVWLYFWGFVANFRFDCFSLAVNVVVCPIIYPFLCVVCVLANSSSRIFYMILCFEYKVNAYQ